MKQHLWLGIFASLITFAFGAVLHAADDQPALVDGGLPYPDKFTFEVVIPYEKGVTRRDPSDVIKVGDAYYLWYSKVTDRAVPWNGPSESGYFADIWYATSPDGHQWKEKGQALGKGAPGTWDEHGVFTANILIFGGKYYLYYTGVDNGFGLTTPTHLGVAVSDSPDGPWTKFASNPVLGPSKDPAQFDSMRVDDSDLIVRDGKVWLYYKGRQIGKGPGGTHMGVAIADKPTGPFVKNGQPLDHGHEVLVWPQGAGVASMANLSRMIYFAADGIHFEPRKTVAHFPAAPGAWRSDNFVNHAAGKGLEWGISQTSKEEHVYLLRYDCARGPTNVPSPTSTGDAK